LALPAWLALTEQLPAPTRVSVEPLVLQTSGVVDANETTRPDVDVATRAAGAVPSVWLPGDGKLMVCTPGATVNVRETVVAAAKLLLPAWTASTVQVPAPISVNALPLTVHTLVVVETNDTVRPELAVATRAGAAAPKLRFPGVAKVMVCAVGATSNEFETTAAAA
jgi:hypothetical protein